MKKYLMFGTALGLLALLVVMGAISSSGDPGGILGRFLLILWCIWAPLLSVLLSISYKRAVEYSFIFAGAFIGSFGFSFYVLAQTSSWVLTSGPLQEAALVFMVMPAGLLQGLLIGGGLGFIGALVHRRLLRA